MKITARILLSIFFAIAIGVHIFYVIHPDLEPLWWHLIYFITYGACWSMIFSTYRNRRLLYAIMAVFPFITHVYYALQHMHPIDGDFVVCLLVCIMLPLGFIWIRYEDKNQL